ncbi:hypothetical protein K431DRAFT_302943 [Polychaeton citri CBS 116435]|uniref:Xylanolytic transcriptional activator regulatory domain-containing protein n=1 Tax=Polychaeton citri CBS 116435 TaxID=1314669 RepID=A0A9P4QC55_9PEZI|nr:hypothetical protein K431DRAFT_302943 [Polychaeton citri CBS 116435]
MAHFTFVPQFEAGPGQKRRRVARACEKCRATKKRCKHCDEPSASYETSQSEVEQDLSGPDPFSRPNSASVRGLKNHSASQPSHARNTSESDRPGTPSASASSPAQRFVGDLAPEARFLDQHSPYDRSTHRVSAGDIGVWVDQLPKLQAEHDNARPTVGSLIVPVVDAFALANIYFTKLNIMLPIVSEPDFRTSQSAAISNPALVHVICLVAAKDKQAEPHLRLLRDPDRALSCREYSSELHEAIVAALSARPKGDKPTLIRILALLSLHCEGPDGAEQASVHLSQAMHYAQSMGLHLLRATDHDLDLKRLFWSLWTLDRLNAAINGRPIFMSDIDMAIDPLVPEQTGSVAFDIWLRISRVLNDVIALYRPSNVNVVTGWEHEYPGFEQIVTEYGGWRLPPPLVTTLQAYYLAVAILSHRSKTLRTLPRSTASSVRRDYSAIQIIRMMSSKARQEQLYPTHILPFAASMALSVSYQQLRQTQLPHRQEDARNDFYACCKILQDLRPKWGAADAMAAIGRKVSSEIERMPNLTALHIEFSGLGRDAAPTGNHGEEVLTTTGSLRDEAGATATVDGPATNNMNMDDPTLTDEQTAGLHLFEGMDDIFGMYLDPNNPVNFDDLPFMDA